MALLQEIEEQAKIYARERDKLADIVREMNDAIEGIKRANMARLKNAVNRTAENGDALRALVDASPELFVRPRSVVMHGIKLGFQKQRGSLDWEDADQVVKLIRKHYPDLADTLIAVTEKPAKTALGLLSVAELRKIGVSLTADSDVVFIKPTDSGVEKLVEALLKDAQEEVV